MDDFQSISSGSGLLKDYYDDSPLGKALKKKREKMAKNKEQPDVEIDEKDLEQNE